MIAPEVGTTLGPGWMAGLIQKLIVFCETQPVPDMNTLVLPKLT